MNAPDRKSAVMHTLIAMVTEVIGDDGLLEPIAAESSFRDTLGFDSIQFIALAELIQERYAEVNFVTWLQDKELAQIVLLKVGDVADFVVSATPA
jgi:acyl carrier protein